MIENEELPELKQESVMIGLLIGTIITGLFCMLWHELRP
jgi:hypothetical protein